MRRRPDGKMGSSMTPRFVLCALAGILAHDIAMASDSTWHMRPVTSIQARIETYKPLWDNEHKVWVSGIEGNLTFEERYAATLDSVTTSSVEGVLMYLQRDCIDIGAKPWDVGCKRKNDVKVITFMEVQIANPNAALAEYQSDRYTYPEFCPFVEMREGQCIFTNDTVSNNVTRVKYPPECKQYNGADGQPNIGPCVGAEAFPTDNIAPYFDTVWFSYPNSCVMNKWKDGKSTDCRKENPGGLCPFGTTPDGVKCSFSYKILGYLMIDDLVGITRMERREFDGSGSSSGSGSRSNEDTTDGSTSSATSDTRRFLQQSFTMPPPLVVSGSSSASGSDPTPSDDGRFYQNYTEFCMDKRIEFTTFDKDRTLGLRDVKSIEFWGFPSDHRVNKNRTAFMIQMYNKLSDPKVNNMQPLPLPTELDELSKKNPPCYENAKVCYDAHYGCVRHSYAQVCSVCKEMGAKCVVKVPAYTFPTLTKAPRTVSDSELRSRTVKGPNQKDTSGVCHGQGGWAILGIIVTSLYVLS